jgi:hypothetical protein
MMIYMMWGIYIWFLCIGDVQKGRKQFKKKTVPSFAERTARQRACSPSAMAVALGKAGGSTTAKSPRFPASPSATAIALGEGDRFAERNLRLSAKSFGREKKKIKKTRRFAERCRWPSAKQPSP